jgi:hypothetical protein
LSGSASLTLSAATDSKLVKETSTVTITASFTSNVANETFTIKVLGTGATDQDSTVVKVITTDSVNVIPAYTWSEKVANAGTDSLIVNANDSFTRVKATLTIRNIMNVGTHTYNVNL